MKRTAVLLTFLFLSPSILAAQGSLLLVGGGSEDNNDWSDGPYRWFVTHAPNRKILVLHYEDTTSFFSGYFPWLSPCSVANRAITSTSAANDSATYRFILGFDGIFLRGGDQWQYVDLWRGTLTAQALREVFARGGVIGGTSAGEAVLSEVVFDARQTSVAPRTALRNPFAAGITLTNDFLGLLPGTLADSHFFERGRLGRLPAFLAVAKEQTGREVTGIGVEYGTALAIGPDGIGEVMGSGTVTILRYAPGTTTILASGAPLSMHGMLFDQLTAGSRFHVADGTIDLPPDAWVYNPVRFVPPAGAVILDGGNSIADWSRTRGSLERFRSFLGSTADSVAVISSMSGAGVASAVAATLTAQSVAAKLMLISAPLKNDLHFAAGLASCRGIVFYGNVPDSLAAFLDSTTLAGQAFHSIIDRGSPVLFLSDDVMLAGEEGIGQMYKSIYGAYYGYLLPVRGLGVVKGLRCVPRLYEASDYIDNRASALFWSMVRGHVPLGLLLDNGSCVTITGAEIAVSGATPVMVADARGATHGSVPSFRDPGKATPRQLGGIIHGSFSVVRDGEAYLIGSGTHVNPSGPAATMPSAIVLLQNYPNPFNPNSEIRYQISEFGMVQLAVYDLLGREVAVLVNEKKAPGTYTVPWNAAGVVSGMYICRLVAGSSSQSRKMLLLR
jgi:cyanophycinase